MKTPRLFAKVGLGILLLTVTAAGGDKPPLYTTWINYTHANGFPEGEVFCVTVDGNRVWAGTANGLALIENGRVEKIFTQKDGLAGRAVMGVAVDHETGTVWIGTFGGLTRYSGGTLKSYTNLTSGLANDLVYGVAIQGKYVWVATAGGVSRLNTYDESWTIFNEKNAPFEEPWAYGVVVSGDKVYFAVWGGGVIYYDSAKDYWRPYTDPDGEMELVLYRNQGLIHIIVSNVTYNPASDMFWASTYFGLSGYDGRNWHNYLTKDSGLASDFINAPKARGDDVWACTDKGLSYLNFKTNTWVTYRPDPKTGRGEILITWSTGRKEKLETATTLAHNYILNMDFQGDDIWVATAQGLSHGIREPQKEEKLYESASFRH